MTVIEKTDVALLGHRVRRAGFGLPARKLEELVDRGYDAIVDDLVDF